MKTRLFSLSFLLLPSVSVFAQNSVNTIPLWDGTNFISSFGVPNTATYGQTITVNAPGGPAQLQSISFRIGNCGANTTFRIHVYAWDGTKATGSSLFDSAPQTISASPAFTAVTVSTGSVNLTSGQYILFASTSEDQAGAPPSACRWGALPNNTGYSGGQFYFENNTANTAAWTTQTWATIGEDLAFQAVFNDALAVPTLSEWGLIILAGLLLMFGIFALPRRLRSGA